MRIACRRCRRRWPRRPRAGCPSASARAGSDRGRHRRADAARLGAGDHAGDRRGRRGGAGHALQPLPHQGRAAAGRGAARRRDAVPAHCRELCPCPRCRRAHGDRQPALHLAGRAEPGLGAAGARYRPRRAAPCTAGDAGCARRSPARAEAEAFSGHERARGDGPDQRHGQPGDAQRGAGPGAGPARRRGGGDGAARSRHGSRRSARPWRDGRCRSSPQPARVSPTRGEDFQ